MANRSDDTCYRGCPGMTAPHKAQAGFCSPDFPIAVPATSVFIAPDGTVYRFAHSETNARTGKPIEKFDVLTLDGYQSVSYELPAGSRLAWTPTLATT